ncbi:MAG TPA: hypothetical protein VEH76_02465 [Methylocystis sp.]|nr:hypothetical protein [Methylocystis sp.]
MSSKHQSLGLLDLAQFRLGSAVLLSALAGAGSAYAKDHDFKTLPGDLLLSRTVYDNNAANVTVGQQLPPNCTNGNCVPAQNNGAFPQIFNNAPTDGSFGITSKILLDEMTLSGATIKTFEIPNNTTPGVTPNSDQMVTSFSSKSELALNLSLDGQHVTFMGYLAPVDALDVSNSNTPAVIDPTNPVPNAYYRVVADLDLEGDLHFTSTNAYSGNNGRAAILRPFLGSNLFYSAGNAGNGSNPQPNGVILGAGAQGLTESTAPLPWQDPGLPTPVASFNITELGDTADKIGKDDNFRGMTVFNNVLYYTKGSGGNGVDTVYFVDTSGTSSAGAPLACPNGVGLPAPGAKLPNTPLSYNLSTLQTNGLPNNICVLKGFNTVIAKTSTNSFPFGLWFANATTVYVADEGDGTATYDATTGRYTAAAASTTAGLQKWVFNAAAGQWQLAYTLQAGLELGVPYTVTGYPTGANSYTVYKSGKITTTTMPSWSPATDGLRNLTGRVNRDGTVTIWAVTSTVSGSGDQGADPNKLVAITDTLAATSLPANESFTTLRTAGFAEVLRGVSFTPGTEVSDRQNDWSH